MEGNSTGTKEQLFLYKSIHFPIREAVSMKMGGCGLVP